MFLEDVPINLTGVLVAGLVYFIIGMIWYSPWVFGHQTRRDEEILETSLPEQVHRKNLVAYIGELIIAFIIAYVLALFIELSDAEAIIEGITIALWVWVGFIATTHFSAVLWKRKSVKHFFIHSGFILVGLIAMAVALMYFEV